MTATKRKPKPMTANPLFPFVTALWFATLFGLGSFATAPMLLEGPVVALGIPALIPAAAPPLGFTTRIVFALTMMGLGAALGYMLGRLLGRSKVATPVPSRGFGKAASPEPEPKGRRPINATQDLGAPLDAPQAQAEPSRRRALVQSAVAPVAEATAFKSSVIETDEVFEPEFEEKQIFQSPAAPSFSRPAEAVVDPLGLDLLLEQSNAFELAPFMTSQPMFAAPHEDAQHLPVQSPETARVDPVEFEPEVEFETEVDEVILVPAALPTLERFAAPAKSQPAFADPSPLLQARAADATPLDRAPLDNLGLVQLVERLALAISHRVDQANQFEHPAPKPAEFAAPEAVAPPPIARHEMEPRVPQETAMPRLRLDAQTLHSQPASEAIVPPQVVQLRPAALQPLQTFGEAAADGTEDIQDNGLERFLRMSPLLARKHEQIAAVFADIDEPVADSEVAEDCYPSLLDMASTVVRREPLRIDDRVAEDDAIIEPRVVFPGQERPVLTDTNLTVPMQTAPISAAPLQSGTAQFRPFAQPAVKPVPGSPLTSPRCAAPSAHSSDTTDAVPSAKQFGMPDATEADRALRAALATLQQMTARG